MGIEGKRRGIGIGSVEDYLPGEEDNETDKDIKGSANSSRSSKERIYAAARSSSRLVFECDAVLKVGRGAREGIVLDSHICEGFADESLCSNHRRVTAKIVVVGVKCK